MDLNTLFDKIYIITYVYNIDQRKLIANELNRIGINNYEFVYSYDNSLLKLDDNINIDIKQISISFTHYDIIKKSYELGLNNILLFEDDVAFLKNVEEIHNIITHNESLKYNINYYDYQFYPTDRDDIIQVFLTSAYSLNKQGMIYFIKNFENCPFLIDGYMILFTDDYHTIPNNTITYENGMGKFTLQETRNTSVNIANKRICIQHNKLDIYNDVFNYCDINEYNIEYNKNI